MTNFHSIVFADWPRGLYFAQQLAFKGQKVAYVEIIPRFKNPFALFLNDSFKEEKNFLESLGSLYRQEGGFCLLSPEGVWPLQDRKEMGLASSKESSLSLKDRKSFQKNWLSYLSLNLAAKVFEYNNSVLTDQVLDLFSDYFLFEPLVKKLEHFKKSNPNIYFLKAEIQDISIQEDKCVFRELSADNFFCFSSRITHPQKTFKAYWQWQVHSSEADFAGYQHIIPSHFVCLKNIFFPWCYDNLLSVFQKEGIVEIWMKLKLAKDQSAFIEKAKQTLEAFFPGVHFNRINKASSKSFYIYGEESLDFKVKSSQTQSYIENFSDFFQGDLVSEIRNEARCFKRLNF